MKTLILMLNVLVWCALVPVPGSVGNAPLQGELSTTIYSMDFVNETLGYAVGAAGIFLKTVDGGANWNVLNWSLSGRGVMLRDVDFVDENEGWIVMWNGTYGSILHTPDGGNTLTVEYTSPHYWRLNAVGMVNSTFGWAGGTDWADGGHVVILGYNGTAWNVEPVATLLGNIRDIFVIDESKAFAVGDYHHVWEYRPENPQGEQNWICIIGTPGRGVWFEQAWFVNRTLGYAVTAFGGVHQLLVKFGTYRKIADFGEDPLSDIVFYNQTHGWLSTYRGEVFNTIDGGYNWAVEMEEVWGKAWRCLEIQHSTPTLWVGGGLEAEGFGGNAELTMISKRGSPWTVQLAPTMTFNVSGYVVRMEADSTLTNFAYNVTAEKIYFKVFGPTGYVGKCNITVPKPLVKTLPKIAIDGVSVLDYQLNQNSSHYLIYIQYSHSIHDVELATDWLVGDFDGDGDVDIFDIVAIAGSYGQSEGQPRYHRLYDVAENYGVIDIFDVVAVATNYGK